MTRAANLYSKITQIAREHSQGMITRNYFKRDTPDELSPSQRGINDNVMTV